MLKLIMKGIVAIVFVACLLGSGSVWAQDTGWEVPKEMYTKKNPVALNEDVLAKGKSIYVQMCVLCHGPAGIVEGNMATMDPPPTNLTVPAFQDQSDGVIYYKIRKGKPPKPSFEHHLTEEETWKLVHYLRTLKKE